MASIKLVNLHVEYPLNDHKLVVLDNLNYEFKPGAISVILGRSGCGKTTLLRMIQGLEKPTSGHIEMPNLKLAYVFQEPRLMPWLNVKENILFGLQAKESVDLGHYLDLIGLKAFEKHYPYQLSGGMSSRVALARALVRKPDFLLMDEPFAALDYFTRLTMQKLVKALYEKEGCGILLVTHSVDEALLLANEIVILHEGKIINTYHIETKQRDLLSSELITLKKAILNDLAKKGLL